MRNWPPAKFGSEQENIDIVRPGPTDVGHVFNVPDERSYDWPPLRSTDLEVRRTRWLPDFRSLQDFGSLCLGGSSYVTAVRLGYDVCEKTTNLSITN